MHERNVIGYLEITDLARRKLRYLKVHGWADQIICNHTDHVTTTMIMWPPQWSCDLIYTDHLGQEVFQMDSVYKRFIFLPAIMFFLANAKYFAN